jgi:molybdopterin adenylyltransferase
MSQSSEHHRKLASDRGPVAIGLITVSDSRTPETDTNGAYLRAAIGEAGHDVSSYHLIRDEAGLVRSALKEMVEDGITRVVLLNGGTGIARRDTTYDAIRPLLDREIPGFGELFRMLSFEQVGSAAMLSRATAGIHRGVLIFSMPGSPAAVRLAWERLIAPELEHLAWEVTR